MGDKYELSLVKSHHQGEIRAKIDIIFDIKNDLLFLLHLIVSKRRASYKVAQSYIKICMNTKNRHTF